MQIRVFFFFRILILYSKSKKLRKFLFPIKNFHFPTRRAKNQIFHKFSLTKIRYTLNFHISIATLLPRIPPLPHPSIFPASNWTENALIFACRFDARINGHVGYVSRNAEVSRTAASETHIKAVDKRKGALIVRRSSIHEVAGYGYTYVLRCAYTDPCVHVPTHAMRLLTCARVVYVCYHQHGRKRVLPCVVTAHTHVHNDGMVSGSGE